MNHLAVTLACFALLATIVSAAEQLGNETISADKRPVLDNSNTASSEEKKRSFQLQSDGTTMKVETEGGKSMSISIAYFCEVQEDGTQVWGPDGINRVDEGSEERDKLKVDPPSGADDVDSSKFDADTIDPERKIPRPGQGGDQQTTPEQTPPPEATTLPAEPETTVPPSRRRRDVSQGPSEDDVQTLASDDITKQTIAISYDLDKRDEGSGLRIQFAIKAHFIESEGNITIGSETHKVNPGDMKIQLEITDYPFCGDGGRDCNGTVGKALKACFEHKGSSGASDNLQEDTNTEDDTKKFTGSEGSVKYSARYMSNGTVFVMADDDVSAETNTLDNIARYFVCVKFYRPQVGVMGSYTYDPTGFVDDDDDDDDDADSTTQSRAARLTFALIGWVLVAVLKIVL